jgi:hypothetical protein
MGESISNITEALSLEPTFLSDAVVSAKVACTKTSRSMSKPNLDDLCKVVHKLDAEFLPLMD